MEQLTFLSEAHPAKTSVSQESEWDSAEKEAYSHSTLCVWLMKAVQNSLLGRTFPVYSAATAAKILPNCYRYSQDGKLIRPRTDGEDSESSSSRPDVSGWRGGSLTCSMPEWTAFRTRYRNGRNRVFVVGYLGDWRRAAQVLFEPEGLLGNTPPRREAGKGVAEGAERGVAAGRPWDETGVNPSLCRGGLGGIGASNQELFSQDANGLVFDARGNGDGVAYTLDTPTLNCNHEAPILALAGNTIGRKPDNGGNGCGYKEDVSYTLTKTDEHGIMQGSSVRRLTPIECERLMGFPANWTRIPWRGKPAEDCPDGPRYKACGNSMGVNVMRWIGTRIQEVEDIHKKSNRANTACISAGEVL